MGQDIPLVGGGLTIISRRAHLDEGILRLDTINTAYRSLHGATGLRMERLLVG